MTRYQKLIGERIQTLRAVIDLSHEGLSADQRFRNASQIDKLMMKATRLQDLIYEEETFEVACAAPPTKLLAPFPAICA